MFKGGDSLIIETNLGEGGRVVAHLHFVLLDPDEVTGNTIIVNIESLTSPRQDQTVVLDQSERHSFIRQKSFVNYSRAMIVSVSAMRELVDRRKARLSDPIPAKLLARIRGGLERSERTPEEVLMFFKDRAFERARLSTRKQTRTRGR